MCLCFGAFILTGKTQRLISQRKPCFHKYSTLDRQKNHKLLIHVIMRRSGSSLGQTGFNCAQVALTQEYSCFSKNKTMFPLYFTKSPAKVLNQFIFIYKSKYQSSDINMAAFIVCMGCAGQPSKSNLDILFLTYH